MHASKIGDLALFAAFATVGALPLMWLLALVGLSLTIKREYLHTFVSLQTGYAASQSIFLGNQGNVSGLGDQGPDTQVHRREPRTVPI